MPAIALGPFDLLEPIGRGGMGEIWSGIHRGQQVQVAVKVLTSRRAANPSFRASFRKEVRAVAALDHPHIVMVFDHGEVSPEAATSSNGRLIAGIPYLAMEMVEGGSLAGMRGQLEWDVLRECLLALLGALAHAHARGVIHRDIKPGNVLQSAEGVKLTDFGLAHPREPELDLLDDDAGARGGTPAYMAPEQFQGGWRDYGPWTDLYAFGCMAWAMVSGRPPFKGDQWVETMHAHLTSPIPRLRPRRAVPEGFEDWLRKLLQKDPTLRFRRAADAAWALLDLDPPTSDIPGIHRGPVRPAVNRTTLFWEPDDLRNRADVPEPAKDAPPDRRFTMPRLPADWRRDPAPPRSIRLVGAGLGLYGLRTIPLVDREGERDRLWRTLQHVQDTGRPQAILLRGPAGSGKSRLAEWLCERAHEVGAASILKAVHSPVPGPVDGLGAMVARHMRVVGLPRRDVGERLSRNLLHQGVADEYEWRALTELIAPATQAERREGARMVRFGSPSERFALIGRMLERLADERPVLLWIEDVQWAADALALTEALLSAPNPRAVLVLMTVREESLVDRPDEHQQIRDLTKLGLHELDVRALSAAHTSALIRRLLMLEGAVADQVEARAAGNPLFAVQLVGDWVQRGLLEPGESGFRLKEGVSVALPDDMHAVWSAAVNRVLDGMSATARFAVELGAALGMEFDAEEWFAVGREAGHLECAVLAEHLVAARLLRPVQGGWAWVHGMLRESLVRDTREAGRWEDHNRLCAEMLRRTGRPSGRLGLHLLEAGDYEGALDLLLEGVEGLRARSEYRAALRLLDGYDRAVDILEFTGDGPRRMEGWLARASVYNRAGRPHMAAAWADRAEEALRNPSIPDTLRAEALQQQGEVLAARGYLDDAERYHLASLSLQRQLDNPVGIGNALLGVGKLHERRGRFDRAAEVLAQARAAFIDVGDRAAQAHTTRAMAVAAQHGGHLDRARELAAEALDTFEKLGSTSGVARCLKTLATLALITGEPEEAAAHTRAALSMFEQIGDPSGQLSCINGLAEIARYGGDLVDAERGYRQALELAGNIGHADAVLPRINLVLVVLRRGRYNDADVMLDELVRRLEPQGRRGLLGAAHLCLALCSIGRGRLKDFERHFLIGRGLLEQTGFADPDNAWILDQCGELAFAAALPHWAQACWELAMFQHKDLGNEAEAGRLKQLLQARFGKGPPIP